jgi:hypothetical protein
MNLDDLKAQRRWVGFRSADDKAQGGVRCFGKSNSQHYAWLKGSLCHRHHIHMYCA